MSDDIEIHMYIKGTLPNKNPTIGFLRSLTKRKRDVAKISIVVVYVLTETQYK